MRDAAAENWKYSDPENYELRSAIAAHHGVPIECVVVGEGIDGLLGLTCIAVFDAGQRRRHDGRRVSDLQLSRHGAWRQGACRSDARIFARTCRV